MRGKNILTALAIAATALEVSANHVYGPIHNEG